MLIRGDARQIPLRDGVVQCVVTSPPYWGLRDYGSASQIGLESSPYAYVDALVSVFAEVHRVLRDDGVCWLNIGDCYATGAGKVGESPGGGAQGDRWKGYKGSRNGHEGKHGYGPSGTGVGPMTQPNRLPIEGLKTKDLCMIPARVAIALQTWGWYLRADVIWSKPNPMPESITDRPTKAHEHVFLLTKGERYYYDHEAIKEPYAESTLREIEEGYEGQATKDYDGAGVQNPSDTKRRIIEGARRKNEQTGDRRKVGFNDRWDTKNAGNLRANAMSSDDYNLRNGVGRNRRSVWNIPTQPYRGAHFAVMPEALAEPCILAGSRPGDLVFDPFIGSGTVGVVASRLMRRWAGLDLSYHEISSQRTSQRGLPVTA